MHPSFKHLRLLIAVVLLSSPAFAAKPKCEADLTIHALTLKQLKDRSAERAKVRQKIVPAPRFDNIEDQAKVEQEGEIGPLALQEILPKDVSFVSTPAPTSADPIAVDLVEEGSSFPVHVDTELNGRRASTAAFVSLPKAKISSRSEYLVGSEYPVVLVHFHGGGTPTATGRNAMSIGKELAKRNIPVIGLDMPGHGRATKNPDGLLTFAEQADWLMQVVNRLVDPKTKIVVSGHSWGGAFALFMHRLSADPKYARISQFIALSPPVDVSLGGSTKEKMEFEQKYQKEFVNFKDQIAPADFEFQSNMLDNGKDSDVSTYFTTLTDLDFRTPPLSVIGQARLKRLTVVVGTADGLVYVGREQQFKKAFGNLVAPSRYIELGSGQTWKSKSPSDLLPTGHNIFDRYIDGTQTLEVYQLLGDLILEDVGSPIPDSPALDPVKDLVERSFRYYSNFFGFREMLRDRIEYVRSDNPQRPLLSKRRGELDEYLKRSKGLEEELEKLQDPKAMIPQVQKAIDELRARLGIKENLVLKRAEEDLATPEMTSERRQAIEKYIADVGAVEEKLRTGYVDEQYQAEIQSLNSQFKKLCIELGIENVTDYKGKFESYQAIKKPSPDEQRIRGELSRLHQKFSDSQRKRMSRFGVARDAMVSGIVAPEGVRDARSAQRELTMDRSPERMAKLKAFVAEYPAVDAAARAQALKEWQEKLAQQKKPEGVRDPQHAREMKAQTDAILSMTVVPEGHPELKPLVTAIGELNAAVEALEFGDGTDKSIEKLELEVKQARVKRASLLKSWEGLWRAGQLTSPIIRQGELNTKRTLDSYKDLYFTYEEKKSNFLLQLKESGALTAAKILNSTPQLKMLRAKVQHAKQVYFKTRQDLEALRWSETRAGKLEGPADLVKKAGNIARDLEMAKAMKVEEEYLASRQAQLAERQRELAEKQVEYIERMHALGQTVPFEIVRVNVGKMFDQELTALENELATQPLHAQALSQTLAKWESFLTRLRTENQSKDGGGY